MSLEPATFRSLVLHFTTAFLIIMSTVILLTFADSRRVDVSYKRKYVLKVLVNRFVKLA